MIDSFFVNLHIILTETILQMQKITIVYGSDTGNTQSVAARIAEKLVEKAPVMIDVANIDKDVLTNADVLILGTPTTGFGNLQDDWDGFLSTLEATDLSDKVVALFGLGDAVAYPETFVDALGLLFQSVKKTGANIVGFVPTEKYSFESSTAVEHDSFVGLVLDEDNESEATERRISDWLKSITAYL